MPPMSDDLKTILPQYISKWRCMSRFYAIISVILRGTLIITSAVVAAKASALGEGRLVGGHFAAILSIYVAAGTGIEAWLKPREKWKGFMTDCENAEDLFMRLDNSNPADNAEIEKFRTEFQRLLATHREKHVF